ncbi:Pyroglutamyl-peptidase 1 [Cricetulus griseus]|uniref:Pyroglutamyl-peptidase I n=2 Tax=Cricetulus griseus TaxID=10029 RepID=G3H4A3_CRIGR|nr:Pyroglutamyl-peptidase 1 [Cricetulus griseus]
MRATKPGSDHCPSSVRKPCVPPGINPRRPRPGPAAAPVAGGPGGSPAAACWRPTSLRGLTEAAANQRGARGTLAQLARRRAVPGERDGSARRIRTVGFRGGRKVRPERRKRPRRASCPLQVYDGKRRVRSRAPLGLVRRHLVGEGFGPFGEHTVNASWIAVQELEKLGLGDSVDLHVYEIPVEYQTVQRLIPALWEKHSPQLVVHVGVSGMATTVTLEKCGHNKGYKGLDNCRFCPGSQCCVEDGPESIDSIIDMDAVCKRVTTLGLDVSVTISQDAGRYLCDFTYYTSLYQGRGRSAFVHVPPLGKPYNADQLGRALRAIIEEMLGVLEQVEGDVSCCHQH